MDGERDLEESAGGRVRLSRVGRLFLPRRSLWGKPARYSEALLW